MGFQLDDAIFTSYGALFTLNLMREIMALVLIDFQFHF